MECDSCGEPVNPERWALGFTYCMKKQCYNNRPSELTERMRLVLLPKQGYTIVEKTDPFLYTGGRSSGR